MEKYKVEWEQKESVYIEADSEQKAIEMVSNGEFNDDFVEHGEVTRHPYIGK
jgi:DNA-dependent RNA polymerase auxiliary subunit epsilon